MRKLLMRIINIFLFVVMKCSRGAKVSDTNQSETLTPEKKRKKKALTQWQGPLGQLKFNFKDRRRIERGTTHFTTFLIHFYPLLTIRCTWRSKAGRMWFVLSRVSVGSSCSYAVFHWSAAWPRWQLLLVTSAKTVPIWRLRTQGFNCEHSLPMN